MKDGDDLRESHELSTVPVILQCEDPIPPSGCHTTTAATATSIVPDSRRRGGDGSVLSAGSTPSYESSSASSSSCLSIMPPSNNGGGQGVFIAENAHYFELPAERGIPSVSQRGFGIPTSNQPPSSGSSNPALLSRVHHLLFGNGNSSNDYQNVRHLVKSSPSTRRPERHQMQNTSDWRDPEATQLEVLQQRLLAMEEHLNQERRDMQKAVASNMRMMESQERCINELIEEINRLQGLRANPTNSTDRTSSSTSTNRPNEQHISSSSTPTTPQQQFSMNSWW